jgi:hypothetical protein
MTPVVPEVPVRRIARLAAPLAAALWAFAAAPAPARAEGPIEGPGQEEAMAKLRELSIRISKALEQNEDALARLSRGEDGKPQKVDISLPGQGQPPPEEAPEPAKQEAGEPTECLREGAETGKGISKDIEEFLKIATRMGSSQEGEGGPPSGQPSGGKEGEGKEGRDRNQKKEQDGKTDPLKDDKPGDQRPEGGKESKQQPERKGQSPPPDGAKAPPPQPDLKGIFFAKLPDKVKEAILNGDFDQVPEKYRDLVRQWSTALSTKDAEAAGEGK